MIVCIEAIAMPPTDGACAVQLFAYTREETSTERQDNTTVQSANHALQIVDSLCYKEREHADGEATIKRGEPPRTEEHTPLWIIQIQVRNTHHGIATYRSDYHKFVGCPNDCAEYMMEVYAVVRGVIRRARKDLRAMREEKRKGIKNNV